MIPVADPEAVDRLEEILTCQPGRRRAVVVAGGRRHLAPHPDRARQRHPGLARGGGPEAGRPARPAPRLAPGLRRGRRDPASGRRRVGWHRRPRRVPDATARRRDAELLAADPHGGPGGRPWLYAAGAALLDPVDRLPGASPCPSATVDTHYRGAWVGLRHPAGGRHRPDRLLRLPHGRPGAAAGHGHGHPARRRRLVRRDDRRRPAGRRATRRSPWRSCIEIPAAALLPLAGPPGQPQRRPALADHLHGHRPGRPRRPAADRRPERGRSSRRRRRRCGP